MTVVLIEIDGIVQDSSSSSVSVGTGSKSFTTDNSQPFKVGMTVTADAGSGNNMTGTITGFNANSMTLNVASTNGSGSHSSWVIEGTRTIDFGSIGYQQKYGDVDEGRFYDGRLQANITFEHYLFTKGRTYGKSSTGIGSVVVSDPDGVYDFMLDIGFNGQQIRIKTLADQRSSYSEAVTKFTGSIDILDYNWNQKIFVIKDRLSELDKPAQESVFDGSNSGATGIEGLPDDLEGKTKPFVYGYCQTVSPPLLNSSSLIYGLNFDSDGNTKAVSAIENVSDSGLALSLDTGIGTSGDFSDLASLQAASISAGQYATCLAEGLFRLESSPAGVITCDVTEGASASDRTAAQIAKNILEDRGGYSASDYESSSISALDTANSSVCGVYIDKPQPMHNIITEVLGSIGANIFENADGKFDFARIVDPGGETSLLTLRARDIIESPAGGIERIKSRDEGGGVPAKQIKVNHSKNFRVFRDNEFVGAVSDEDRAALKQEYRTAAGSIDSNIESKHANSPIIEFETLLTSAANADTELSRLEGIYNESRAFYEVMTRADDLLDVGDVLTVEIPRFGYNAGKKFLIIGRVLLLGSNRVIYAIWG